MTKTLQENIVMAQHLLEEGYNYLVRDQYGPLVASSAKPCKFEDLGEWGSPQTMSMTNIARPVDSEYFSIVQWVDEEPVSLESAIEFYELAKRLEPSSHNEPIEEEEEISPTMATLMNALDRGMEYVVIQPNDEVNLYANRPVFDEESNRWISSEPNEFRTVINGSEDLTEYFEYIQEANEREEIYHVLGVIYDILEEHGINVDEE